VREGAPRAGSGGQAAEGLEIRPLAGRGCTLHVTGACGAWRSLATDLADGRASSPMLVQTPARNAVASSRILLIAEVMDARFLSRRDQIKS
jgi:hypothetical protein